MYETTLGEAIDLSKSVEDLDGVPWAAPASGSYVENTAYALRRKPLRDLTDEDLRLGLGQQVGLSYLIPLALGRLEDDPLLDVRHFEGDLLINVLNVPADYWHNHADQRLEAATIAMRAFEGLPRLSEEGRNTVAPLLQEALERFDGRREPRPWIRADQGKAAPPR